MLRQNVPLMPTSDENSCKKLTYGLLTGLTIAMWLIKIIALTFAFIDYRDRDIIAVIINYDTAAICVLIAVSVFGLTAALCVEEMRTCVRYTYIVAMALITVATIVCYVMYQRASIEKELNAWQYYIGVEYGLIDMAFTAIQFIPYLIFFGTNATTKFMTMPYYSATPAMYQPVPNSYSMSLQQ